MPPPPSSSSPSYANVAPKDEEDFDNNKANDDNDDDANLELESDSSSITTRRSTLKNFVLMSVLFSANHGCVASALALAVSRLGSVGSLSSGVMFLSYALSAVSGATYASKRLGPRNALALGMSFFCVYVGCFVVATAFPNSEVFACVLGAVFGGIGGGVIWTAQGSYFSISSEMYANDENSLSASSSFLGGLFAFVYLSFEISLKVLSTVMVNRWYAWETVYGVYSVIAVVSTIAMVCVRDLKEGQGRPPSGNEVVDETDRGDAERRTFLYKVSAALRLLTNDPKMKYMIGLNASYGFSSSFLNSYVSKSVESVAFNDTKSEYVGALSATTACTAAVFSLLFGLAGARGLVAKGTVLSLGATFFFFVAFPFIILRNPEDWGWRGLVVVYAFHGVGRATFEGTLRSVFADMFPREKEGAFANIVLQNGLSTTVGFFVAAFVATPLPLELCVMISSVLGVLGYFRAKSIFNAEERIIATPLI